MELQGHAGFLKSASYLFFITKPLKTVQLEFLQALGVDTEVSVRP
jgi:hypothetical protein